MKDINIEANFDQHEEKKSPKQIQSVSKQAKDKRHVTPISTR